MILVKEAPFFVHPGFEAENCHKSHHLPTAQTALVMTVWWNHWSSLCQRKNLAAYCHVWMYCTTLATLMARPPRGTINRFLVEPWLHTLMVFCISARIAKKPPSHGHHRPADLKGLSHEIFSVIFLA
jgi:hypothetical protein